MGEFKPVRTEADLSNLNNDEIVEGYRAGSRGEPYNSTKSRSWWHGWRNGMTDSGRTPLDEHSSALIKDIGLENIFNEIFGVRH